MIMVDAPPLLAFWCATGLPLALQTLICPHEIHFWTTNSSRSLPCDNNSYATHAQSLRLTSWNHVRY
ncbi:hypothetical protein SCLCIDRAFT_1221125 [Scleroderma citrinum Foug A]|uniref:Secreted protein n=1 Tax=Scleroderma citrinum Foug A TaxID=1036808 RepID=A0A0C3DGE5_9AGAM|nr:hypothetical protein SCLCIDRAFT_1221125 [Scleroderma citrinum Foug A]